MDIYFNCTYCDKTVAINEMSIGEKVACPDCSKIIIVPFTTVKCLCLNCNNPLLTVSKMLGEEILCLKCNKKTVLTKHMDEAEVNFSKSPNGFLDGFAEKTPENFIPYIAPSEKKKVPLYCRIGNYNYFKVSPKYVHVLVALSLVLFAGKLVPVFCGSMAESIINFVFWAIIFGFLVFNANIIYRLEQNSKHMNKKNIESVFIQDMLGWQENYRHWTNKVWDYVLFPTVLLFTLFVGFHWILAFVIVAFQISKWIMVCSVNDLAGEICDYYKAERMEAFQKETGGIVAYRVDEFGNKIET